jgi:hypothetical protein
MIFRSQILLLVLFYPTSVFADNWPAWRGAQGAGVTTEESLPLKWSTQKNVRWKVKLPGPGDSSPIVWGERVFITQSLDPKGTRRALMCFERRQGKLLWQRRRRTPRVNQLTARTRIVPRPP